MLLFVGINIVLLIKCSKLKVVFGMGYDFLFVLMKKMIKWIVKYVNKVNCKNN